MHFFSIDALTGDTAEYSRPPHDGTQYRDYTVLSPYSTLSTPAGNQGYHDVADTWTPSPTYGRTDSPTDSGIETSLSPRYSDNDTGDVGKELAKLSKTSEAVHPPEVSHEKPPHTFVALISMAIQSSPQGRLPLADIYQYLMDNFPYYNNSNRAWRNSIRYNLTMNACFSKDGRAGDGKGNYWRVHASVADDFAKGDYRRRQPKRTSRRKVKSSSGDVDLSTPTSSGYVTMSSTPLGYHPYSPSANHPRVNQSPPVIALSTSGQLKSILPGTRSPSGYTPNGGYSAYHHDYPQPTSQYTSSHGGYFSQPSPPSYDIMALCSSNYGYTSTSSLLQPISSADTSGCSSQSSQSYWHKYLPLKLASANQPMVLETTSEGVSAAQGQGQSVATAPGVAGGYGQAPARYPNVYNSTRIIQNWEMARISHLVMEKDDVGRRLARVLLTEDRADNLFREYKDTCKGLTEAVYQAMLGWHAAQGGYGTIGKIARRLRKLECSEIAEFFPP